MFTENEPLKHITMNKQKSDIREISIADKSKIDTEQTYSTNGGMCQILLIISRTYTVFVARLF